MTLEELRLRVMAAFPGATVTDGEDHVGLDVALPTPFAIEAGEIDGFEVFDMSDEGGEIDVMGIDFVNWLRIRTDDEWRIAQREIERRILSVSAHEIIAARRRLSEPAGA